MQIIDFKRKGNVVRFYLGEKTPDWGWTKSDYIAHLKSLRSSRGSD